MKTVIALFDDYAKLDQAITELGAAGFAAEEIGVLTREEPVRQVLAHKKDDAVSEGVTFGALSGSALGGLIGFLASAGTLLIPGVGPALAAGTMATVLGTTAAAAGVGAAYGGLMGVLMGWGVSEEYIDIYQERLREGASLLVVHAVDERQAELAQRLMAEADSASVDVYDET